MTYNVFGGTLSLTQSISQSVRLHLRNGRSEKLQILQGDCPPGVLRKKSKLGKKRVWKGSHDLLLKIWDLSISHERLELVASNLACKLTASGTNEKNAKLGERESGRGHAN